MKSLILVAAVLGMLWAACGGVSGEVRGVPTLEPAPTAVLPEGVLVRATRLGGIMGLDQTLVEFADGTARVRDNTRVPPEPATFRLNPTVLMELRDALSSPEWRRLGKVYGEDYVDDWWYRIEGGGRTVIARGLAEGYPPVLLDAYEPVWSLFRVWDCGHTDNPDATLPLTPGLNTDC